MPVTVKHTKKAQTSISVQQIKAPATSGVVQSTALERENSFADLYANEGEAGAYAPPYDPDQMAQLVETNNMLAACIDAMVTNIDGTGFEIGPAEDVKDEEISDDIKESLTGFFSQPWPGMSFKTLRKRLRRDLETCGNAYMEVVRNAEGRVALLRRMDPGITRVMRYDDRVFEEQVWSASVGAMITVKMKRRRYVQSWFGKYRYFKEFGAPEVLDNNTGKWVDTSGKNIDGNSGSTEDGKEVPLDNYATEVLHFMAVPHHILPYGIPRWITQTPSVVGSRKAEEFNLGFFDAGGVPPMMIIVSGGEVADKTEEALKGLFFSNGQHKNIATILNVQSTGGSMEHEQTAKVTVERFGSERQKDGMFAQYDKDAGAKIRRAFRLPPLFVGDTQEFNYATALASYRVAEAQVFKPERDHFDEMINTLLMPALIGDDELSKAIVFRSLPISARDSEQQIEAVQIAVTGQMIDREEAIDNLNEIAGLKMTASAQPYSSSALPSSVAAKETPPAIPGAPGAVGGGKVPIQSDGAAPGKSETFKNSRAKKARKGQLDVDEVMAEEATEILKSGETGTRRVFDCVEWMRNIDSEKRDLFGRRVAKAVFCCGPNEEKHAAKLACSMVEEAAEV